MTKKRAIATLVAGAPEHMQLVDNRVHVFVDDQNLFYGITNNSFGKGFRIDFGRLLLEACKGPDGKPRAVGSAYIAGVIPDDDYFWQVAKNQGFNVKRGYLGSGNRSKQDDAFLITDLVSTLFEQPGPSTIVLIAGDADYMPALSKAINKGWRNEVVFVEHGVSTSLQPVVHSFKELFPTEIQLASSMRS
jgi:hypothetical protein